MHYYFSIPISGSFLIYLIYISVSRRNYIKITNLSSFTDAELSIVENEYKSKKNEFHISIVVCLCILPIAPFLPSRTGWKAIEHDSYLHSVIIFALLFSLLILQSYIVFYKCKMDYKNREKGIIEGILLNKKKDFITRKYTFYIQELSETWRLNVDQNNFSKFSKQQKIRIDITPRAKFLLKISEVDS
jgi:hypothetical protein